MKLSSPADIERLIERVIDDLVDECAIREKHLINGARTEAKALVKEAIRIKQRYLEQVREIREHPADQGEQVFRSIHEGIRKDSLSLIDRMSRLGI